MIPRKHFLILTADTGFGHRSAANSVLNAMAKLHPLDSATTILNPIFDQPTPAFLRKTQRDYDRNVLHNQGFYRFTYDFSDSRPVSLLVEGTLAMALYKSLQHIFIEVKPDVILNTNPMFNAPMGMVLDILHSPTPFFTVVTDFSDVHSMWFNNRPDGFFVASESVKAKAVACGILPEKIVVSGIPVDPILDTARNNKQAARSSLGLDPDLPTFLFVGSPRVSGLSEHLEALQTIPFPFQVVVIAGGDEKLFDKISQHTWNYSMHVENFVKNMPAWLACSDLLVTKAGGVIISESMAAGLPVILIDHLPGQETGNVQFVLENKAGVCVDQADQLVSVVKYWMTDKRRVLRQTSENARRIGLPHAALDIAELLWQSAEMKSPVIENIPL